MRSLLFSLVLPCLLATLRAEDPAGMPEFRQAVAAACEKHDAAAFMACAYNEGVPEDVINASQGVWTQLVSGKFPAEGWRFDEVLFVPIDQLAGTQTQQGNATAPVPQGPIQKKTIKDYLTQPVAKKDKLYEFNLKPIGVMILRFTNGEQKTGTMIPVGVTPDGAIRFTSLKPVAVQP